MRFIPNYLPYPSVRYPIYARNGMVCASSPQAAAAGLEAMKKGGNAMDAAVATAAALTVCEPTANGIGSDAFALIWVEKEKKLYGLWLGTHHGSRRSGCLGRCGQPLRRSAHDREHGSGYPLCPGRLSGFPQPGPDVEACL